ncbi:MAG: AGE family epimerase/isomerase [Bacteroidota bacterium]
MAVFDPTPKLSLRTQSQWREAFRAEATQLLDWWQTQMLDAENGGCYGRRDAYNRLYPQAHKGVIMHTRVLWTFAAAGQTLNSGEYRAVAEQMYEYIKTHFLDLKNGGVVWMLDQNGQVINGRKQIYAQAFAIYAFSEYYQLTGEQEALDLALELFALIERHSYDPTYGGYLEAFGAKWDELEDLRLSNKDANEAKTMNTHLHIMEAYVNLYRAYPQAQVAIALRRIIDCIQTRFINPATGHQTLFFDEQWQAKSSAISYGHDIECSWLLWEAAEVLGDEAVCAELSPLVLCMAEATLQEGLDHEGGVLNELDGDHLDADLHWWPQAEAVVGFWNAFELSKRTDYAQAAQNCWQIIERYLKDQEKGEWHWRVNAEREVNRTENKAGPWKAPYHNVRMCLEMIRRLSS